MEEADQPLVAWTTDCLTNKPECVRPEDCASSVVVVVCITRASQGIGLSLFFSVYTSDSESAQNN